MTQEIDETGADWEDREELTREVMLKKRYSLADHSAESVQAARETVANFWAENAREIRREDPYASHVTEQEKDECLQKSLTFAERIRDGKEDHCFTVLQRMIFELTGDCPALLP